MLLSLPFNIANTQTALLKVMETKKSKTANATTGGTTDLQEIMYALQ